MSDPSDPLRNDPLRALSDGIACVLEHRPKAVEDGWATWVGGSADHSGRIYPPGRLAVIFVGIPLRADSGPAQRTEHPDA